MQLALHPTSSDGGTLKFCFRLPDKDLALHSVRIGAGGVPELYFGASKNVPTLLEEDIATVFRLVAEKKRPGFFYRIFPPSHRYLERYFKLHSPRWLRKTAVGKLLAEADWSMKCLSIGTRANEDKTVFKSWSLSSELKGLATRVDFTPNLGYPTIMMSCEHVKIQKNDNEIVFPEEPKLKIELGTNVRYTQYITEKLPSIAYYDEPAFLKLQELVKLIVAVEWLYNEKNIRVNEEWVMRHTSKPAEDQQESPEPPKHMIPKVVPAFQVPSKDVSCKQMQVARPCAAGEGAEIQYGYYDFQRQEKITFKQDGTQCPPVKYQVWDIEVNSSAPPFDIEKIRIPSITAPIECKDFLRLLRENSHQDVALPTQETTVYTSTDEKGTELTVSHTIQPSHPASVPLEISTTMRPIDGAKEYTKRDPNHVIKEALLDGDDGEYEEVESWAELISNFTDPIPILWQSPVVQSGGVTTHNLSVQEERVQRRSAQKVPQWEANYARCGRDIAVRAEVGATEQAVAVKQEATTVSEDIPRGSGKRKSPAPQREKRMQDQGT